MHGTTDEELGRHDGARSVCWHRVRTQVYPRPCRHRDVDAIIDHDPRACSLGSSQHGADEGDELSCLEISLTNMDKVDASRDGRPDLTK